MPGCGKSTVARALSELTGRELIDTDELIVQNEGCSIPEIFASRGEEYFRTCESRVAAEVGKMSGKIISTGGGIVTREVNLDSLTQNGVIFFVRRDLAMLSRDGRPLSQGADLEQMYKKRLPLYLNFADYTVDNCGTVQDCAEAIANIFFNGGEI